MLKGKNVKLKMSIPITKKRLCRYAHSNIKLWYFTNNLELVSLIDYKNATFHLFIFKYNKRLLTRISSNCSKYLRIFVH